MNGPTIVAGILALVAVVLVALRFGQLADRSNRCEWCGRLKERAGGSEPPCLGNPDGGSAHRYIRHARP